MDLAFTGPVVEWRGPAPHVFVRLPPEAAAEVRDVAAQASYGWGVVPVTARIGDVTFGTALFPKDGGYLLPLRLAVRRPLALAPGDVVPVHLVVRPG